MKKETTPQKEEHQEKLHKKVEVKGNPMDKATLVKFIGLIAFLLIMIAVVILAWPYFSDLFEPGGVDRVIERVKGAGAGGVLILLGLQFLQIVVAFIPGEITQIAAGMIYGPWFGALIILGGCIIASACVFTLVHKLGAPFVQSMVPTKYLDKFRQFETSGKLTITVFILFLIPGLPKDVFTYLVPLTDMRMRDFLFLSNVGRIPAIVVTTYAADGLVDGRIWQSVLIFIVAALIVVVGMFFSGKIMNMIHEKSGSDRKTPPEDNSKK